MYDELVERLKEDKSWVDQGTTQTEHEIAEHIQQAADAIEELTGFVQEAERDRDEYRERLDKANDAIEELQKRCEQFQYMPPPAWIPVTERLPKEGEFVLVYGDLYPNKRDGGVIAVSKRMDWNYWQGFGRERDITHWMPLPTPPTAEEGER